MVDVEQVFDVLDQNSQIPDDGNELCKMNLGEIEFWNVSFKYSSEKSEPFIIQNISFWVPAGKSYALVGSTGAGKSTIMRLLYWFYDVTEGDILIDG